MYFDRKTFEQIFVRNFVALNPLSVNPFTPGACEAWQ